MIDAEARVVQRVYAMYTVEGLGMGEIAVGLMRKLSQRASKAPAGSARSCSTYTTARKLHYYKCIGSDSWRKLGGSVCDNRMVRQDLLDQIVWTEVIRLLENPALIQQELDRRLAAARSSDPTKKREQSLQRELTRVGKGIERLVNAYQEELLSLEQLRERMPLLRQREQTLRAELQAIADQATDRATFLRLAETLAAFLGRLRSAADSSGWRRALALAS